MHTYMIFVPPNPNRFQPSFTHFMGSTKHILFLDPGFSCGAQKLRWGHPNRDTYNYIQGGVGLSPKLHLTCPLCTRRCRQALNTWVAILQPYTRVLGLVVCPDPSCTALSPSALSLPVLRGGGGGGCFCSKKHILFSDIVSIVLLRSHEVGQHLSRDTYCCLYACLLGMLTL
jgi:hypothetical protein